jgi:O-antigen ligase
MTIEKWLENAEYALLCILAVVLPILEAPKNLALGLVVIVFLIRRLVLGSFVWCRPDALEFGLIWMLLAATVSTVLNLPSEGQFKGVKETLLGVAVCWLIYRGNLSARRRYLLALMIVVGVMIGLVWAGVDVYRGARSYFEFNSAGVVTQSSIYLGIALVMSFGVAFSGGWGDAGLPEILWRRALWWMGTVLMLVGLFVMASRGAILAVAAIGILVVLLHRNPKVWLGSLLAFLVAIGISLMLPDKFNSSRVVEKIQQLGHTGKMDYSDRLRFDMWRIGTTQFIQGSSPVFGIGPRNFPEIDTKKLEFSPPLTTLFLRPNHAHNMFITKLVEEGVFGLAALVFFFGLVVISLFRDWRAGNWLNWQWFGALGAVTVPSIAGSFNTPWIQEHALLGMILFGLYFNLRNSELPRNW